MKNKIRTFIEKNLIIYDDKVQFLDGDNIFAMGFVNSLFAAKLVNFIEQEFQLTIGDDDLDISNFNSVNNIVSFLQRSST